MTNMGFSACRFCALQESAAASAVDRPWLANSEFFALSSVGALVEGWSLICTREHTYNLKEHFKSESFWAFASEAIDIVTQIYGPVVMFEHGAICEDSETSCGTAHAHLHVVPLSADLAKLAVEEDSGLIWQECAIDDVGEVVGEREYLLVLSGSTCSSKARVATLPIGQSQFFRKIIAGYLGRPSEYSYKTHPQVETSARGAQKLLAHAASKSAFATAA